MKHKKYKLAVVLSAAFVLAAHGQTNVPFSEGFQGYAVDATVDSGAWIAPGLAPAVKDSPVSPDATDRLLYSPDQITLQLATDGVPELYSNMWWSAYAQVRQQTNEPAIDGAGAAFFVTDTGDLKAYSNSQWAVVKTGLPTSGWIRFAVHLDYGSKRYDIYRGEAPYTDGNPLTLQNAAPIPFNSAYTSNELTQVDCSGETYLDKVSVVRGNLQSIDTSAPSVANAKIGEEQEEDVALSGNLLSGGALRYFGGASTMAGPFGNALASALENGDQVGVYIPASGWVTLIADGAGGWSAGTPGSINIGPSTGFWLNLTDTNPRIAKYASAYDTEDTHTDDAPVTIAVGWNLLSLPFTVGNKSLGSMNLPSGTGDIVAVNTGGKTYQIRVFNGSWRPNASVTVPAGGGFWYYRSAVTGATTWDYSGL